VAAGGGGGDGQRIVVLVPVQGALVTRPTVADLADGDEVRQGLWALTVRRFVARASDAQARALQLATRKFRTWPSAIRARNDCCSGRSSRARDSQGATMQSFPSVHALFLA
jgi:hypothetical protein